MRPEARNTHTQHEVCNINHGWLSLYHLSECASAPWTERGQCSLRLAAGCLPHWHSPEELNYLLHYCLSPLPGEMAGP